MAIRFETKKVSPRMAREWLKKNIDNNRPEKKSRIPGYARDMAAGNWRLTAETIKFNVDGYLIDGQNRLLAVIIADVSVTFAVAYDVPNDAMEVMDSGASRTAADMLNIGAGVQGNAKLTASIVRWALMWDTGDFVGNSWDYKPTNAEINARYLAEVAAFNASNARGKDVQRSGVGNGSVAGFAHYLFCRVDEEQAKGFFDQYILPDGIPATSPIMVLRNRMIRMKVDRMTRPEMLVFFVKAWNFYRDDEPIDRLLSVKGELTNDNFPQPR